MDNQPMARSHLRQTHILQGIEPLDCGDNQPQARMYFGNRSLRVIVIGQPYSGIDSQLLFAYDRSRLHI